eukprot:1444643-Amphidinium_carterae.1
MEIKDAVSTQKRQAAKDQYPLKEVAVFWGFLALETSLETTAQCRACRGYADRRKCIDIQLAELQSETNRTDLRRINRNVK